METEGEGMLSGNIMKVFSGLSREDWAVGRGLDCRVSSCALAGNQELCPGLSVLSSGVWVDHAAATGLVILRENHMGTVGLTGSC